MMEALQAHLDQINIDYACRALLGGGKGKSVMEELRKTNSAYYESIMSEARKRIGKEVKDGDLCNL